MYSKFVDHMAIAFALFQQKDGAGASKAIQAAFQSPDADKSVSFLLDRNEASFRRTVAASDVGVDFEAPGKSLRVEPVQDGDEEPDSPVLELTDEDLEAPVDELPSPAAHVSAKAKAVAAASARLEPKTRVAAAVNRVTTPKTPMSLKQRYFASLKG